MKRFLFFIATVITLTSQAQQVANVSLQASGLTCSMCSNAINKSLKSVDFVDKVTANVETSTFVITFKPGAAVDFARLQKKVEDAGFSVSSFTAVLNFNNVEVKENEPVTIGDKTFRFINTKAQALNGEVPVRILNKGFVSAKEYKKNPLAPAPSGVYYATI